MPPDPAAAPPLLRPFAALRAVVARFVAVLLDRPQGTPPPRLRRRLPRVDTLPDHLRRDIGFPPGSPFS